jgi:hypothetical protein
VPLTGSRSDIDKIHYLTKFIVKCILYLEIYCTNSVFRWLAEIRLEKPKEAS